MFLFLPTQVKIQREYLDAKAERLGLCTGSGNNRLYGLLDEKNSGRFE